MHIHELRVLSKPTLVYYHEHRLEIHKRLPVQYVYERFAHQPVASSSSVDKREVVDQVDADGDEGEWLLEELRVLQKRFDKLPLRLELPDLEDFEIRDGLKSSVSFAY